MMMPIKQLLALLVLITCSLHATAQTEYFYYSGSQKIPLYLNENRVVLSVPKTYDAISERIRENVNVLVTFKDSVLNIWIISRSDFEKLSTMDSWEEDAKSVIQTSCFYLSEKRKAYAYESPYLSVCLKKEEDENLLNFYAEQYKLRIVKHMTLMPLWYILCVTPDTGKGSLQCANELYESGDFASATPDLAGTAVPDETQVHGITATKKENVSEIFDLQGRPVKEMSTHGIYVKEGRKVIR